MRLAKHLPNIIGGSADLNPSTDTALKGLGDFQPSESEGPGTLGAVGGEWSYAGRNVAFGVREHAMGAAVNGMAAHGGVLPFSATFLHLLRLHEARHPAGRAEPAEGGLRVHARQRRRGRGRPHARTGRATRRRTRHSRVDGHSSRRSERDGGGVGLRGRARRARRCWS